MKLVTYLKDGHDQLGIMVRGQNLCHGFFTQRFTQFHGYAFKFLG